MNGETVLQRTRGCWSKRVLAKLAPEGSWRHGAPPNGMLVAWRRSKSKCSSHRTYERASHLSAQSFGKEKKVWLRKLCTNRARQVSGSLQGQGRWIAAGCGVYRRGKLRCELHVRSIYKDFVCSPDKDIFVVIEKLVENMLCKTAAKTVCQFSNPT